jgi:hypothetical protein
MTKISHILAEKDVKTLEKVRETSKKSDWKVAGILFDNLIRKASKLGYELDIQTTSKVIVSRNPVRVTVIKKNKLKRLRLSHLEAKIHPFSVCFRSLWVNPVIKNNRMKLFWKGQYIDAASLFGESINRYQD